jgi:hypothetical protein
VDLRGGLSPIRNQGMRSTCVSFAVTAAHELLANDGTDLSEEFLHWGCKRVDNMPAIEETTLVAASEALRRVGQASEALWAYDENRDQRAAGYRPSLQACRDAWMRRLPAGQPLPAATAELRTAIDTGDAIVLGVELFASWHLVGADGLVGLPALTMPPLGGHAVMVAGYIDAPAAFHFIVKNSWGSQWGDGGYGYLPAEYVDHYGVAGWAFTAR